jgi:hypothetical protein
MLGMRWSQQQQHHAYEQEQRSIARRDLMH